MPHNKKRVSIVITDLDNTLFDWVHMWHSAFSAMLDRMIAISGIDQTTAEERLLRDIKAIHQHHGTSEYSFLIEEIKLLQELHPTFAAEQLKEHYDDAIHAYNKARKRALKLYDGVLHGLMELRASGCLIVAYTESMAFYTRYRMIKLGLDEIVDILYSPKDHGLPRNLTPEQARRYSPEAYELRMTEHRELEREALKPNARILLDIINDVDGDADQTIYVGDSIMKDIVMAQRAGVTAVHAQYGVAHNRDEEYELLKAVTHWPQYQVEMEKTKYDARKPDYVLKERFDEILQHFEVVPYRGKKTPIEKENLGNVIELWKKTVDVQQHFNDIEIRQFAMAVLAAILGFAGISLREPILVTVMGLTVPVAVLVLGAGLVIWLAFYFMDRHWYHRLLVGAVNHGRKIEKRMVRYFPEIELGEAIATASPMRFFRWKLHSAGKMRLFYGAGAIALVVLMVSLAMADFRPGAAELASEVGGQAWVRTGSDHVAAEEDRRSPEEEAAR